ncbi:MAG: hypothetical protein LAT51_13245 [Flavobacteriaceae bacterium]|nr:hypothetical protein [Flavobacteriaceae bacterium]
MKKILFLLILIPIYSFSQSTSFTNEENQYVELFLEKIKKNESITSYEDAIKEFEKALDKVPYHPDLVFKMLQGKYLVEDRISVVEY